MSRRAEHVTPQHRPPHQIDAADEATTRVAYRIVQARNTCPAHLSADVTESVTKSREETRNPCGC
jgi:hypothetical protein